MKNTTNSEAVRSSALLAAAGEIEKYRSSLKGRTRRLWLWVKRNSGFKIMRIGQRIAGYALEDGIVWTPNHDRSLAESLLKDLRNGVRHSL